MTKAGFPAFVFSGTPEFAVLLLIVGNSFLNKKQRSDEDYVGHPMSVATAYTRSKNKRIIGLLHDLIEDTD